jgi:hypothetical protein
VPGGDVIHTTDLTATAITAESVNTGNSDACAPFDAGIFNGGIGIAYRGGETPAAEPCYFYIKAANMKDAGAQGMIIINNVPGDAITMGGLTDLTFPSVMITQDQGIELLKILSEGNNITIGAFQNSVLPEGAISIFSSRGPNFESAILKPDLAAPVAPSYPLQSAQPTPLTSRCLEHPCRAHTLRALPLSSCKTNQALMQKR